MRKVKCFSLCSIFQSFYRFSPEISSILRSKKTTLLPSAEKVLQGLGENIRLARKRRRLSLQQVAERADIARSTLGLIEKESPGVAMSAYLQVLFVPDLEKDLRQVAADDPLGQKLQDAGLLSGRKK
jgi:DNA-binding XRE family transcriptional regulator